MNFFKIKESGEDLTKDQKFILMDYMVSKILESNGEWSAGIGTIVICCGIGYNETLGYGSYIRAIDELNKEFGLSWKSAGRNGRKYSIDQTSLANYITIRNKSGHHVKLTQQITITCPCCGSPTNYTITIEPTLL